MTKTAQHTPPVRRTRAIGLALMSVLLMTSACGSQPAGTANLAAVSPPPPIKWDEALAATSYARVNNTNLIFMR